MKCFSHRETEAVGVCKACGKAVCESCMAVNPAGISCRGSCEAQLRRGRSVEKGRDNDTSATVKTFRLLAVGIALVACVVLFFGALAALNYDPDEGHPPFGLLFGAGALFFVASLCYGAAAVFRKV